MQKRPYVLSIAGFDPTGGAGVLSDIKTFEAYKTIGLGISTAITYQTEANFLGVDWLGAHQVNQQLEPLLQKYKLDVVKIGLIENLECLSFLVDKLKHYSPEIKIIWDPILQSSTGFSFHDNLNRTIFESLAARLFMITPNLVEINQLYPELSPLEAADHLSGYCKVYLKGGHDQKNTGRDYLISQGKTTPYKAKKVSPYPKHGTGCILSAAFAAGITKTYPLHKAILKGKQYVTNVLMSNKTGLGYHKI